MPERHPITGCRADSLMGLWLVEPVAFEALVAQALTYDLVALAQLNLQAEQAELREAAARPAAAPAKRFQMRGHTAIIPVMGPSAKYPTSYQRMMGGCSTVLAQKSLQAAVADPAVKSIALQIESPGGTVAGAFDLAADIKAASAKKPVVAHGADQMTSAAYLFGSQASALFANENASVGSIGVRSFVIDSSKKFEKEGIKVIPLVSGKFKGAGMPGVEVTPEQVAKLEEQVRDINSLFSRRVAESRRLEQTAIESLDAQTMVASRAQGLGLIDGIMKFEDLLELLEQNPEAAVSRGPARRSVKKVAPVVGADPPARSKAMPLTATQLVSARALPGAASLTEENADVVLLEVAQQLSTKVSDLTASAGKVPALEASLAELKLKLPAAPDASVMQDRLSLALEQIDHLGEKGLLVPTQADALKRSLKSEDGKPNAAMFTPVAAGQPSPYQLVHKVLSTNKPNGVLKDVSADQPAPKQEPGAASEKPKVTLAEVQKARQAAGLAPLTAAEATLKGLA